MQWFIVTHTYCLAMFIIHTVTIGIMLNNNCVNSEHITGKQTLIAVMKKIQDNGSKWQVVK